MIMIDHFYPNRCPMSYQLFHRLMTDNGYCFTREYYPFGSTPTYTHPDGHKCYYYKGRLLMWHDVRRDLLDNWCLLSEYDIMWFEQNVK